MSCVLEDDLRNWCTEAQCPIVPSINPLLTFGTSLPLWVRKILEMTQTIRNQRSKNLFFLGGGGEEGGESVFKLFTLSSSSPEPLSQTWQTWHEASLGEGDLSLSYPSLRGDNNEIAKSHGRNSKMFFSKTTGPISTKLYTKIIRMKVSFRKYRTFSFVKREIKIFFLSIYVMV